METRSLLTTPHFPTPTKTKTTNYSIRPRLPSLAIGKQLLSNDNGRSIACKSRMDNDKEFGGVGRQVDEDMIVLRLRIKEMEMMEGGEELSDVPSNWMEWEKKYYNNMHFHNDVYGVIGFLQLYFMSTRPSVAFGIVMYVALSLCFSTGVVMLRGMELLRWVYEMAEVLLMVKTYEGEMKHESFIGAIVALLKLISLTLIGVLLAHPKHKLVPIATFKLLSKLVFTLFLPCLIFTHLGESITLKNFTLWWFIPVNVILSTAIGSALGYMVALICRPPPEYFRFTVIMTGLGNIGNLPLAIITSVCHSKNHSFGQDCKKKGVAYDSFAQWVAVTLVYTFVYHMMEPPIEYYDCLEATSEDEMEDEGEISSVHLFTDSDLSIPLINEAEWPGLEDKETEHSKTPFIYRVFNSLLNKSSDSVSNFGAVEEDPRSIMCLAEPKVVKKIRIVAEQTPIKHILQPPTIASLLAITIGMVPKFKALVYGEQAPFSFLTDSFQIMSGAMVPSVMLVLGGMLAEGPDKSRLGLRTTVGIIVARLLVLPLIGIGVLLLADKLDLLVKGDQMFRFVILLHYVTPSAILLGAMASLRGYAVQEASALLFWQHVFAVVSVSMYIVIFFRFLLSYAKGYVSD